MGGEGLSTLQKIMAEGKNEFLEKGYKDASLRNIAKRAGVTTGAIYGYYSDKAALFDALVSPTAEELRSMYMESIHTFDGLPEERKISEMHTDTEKHLEKLLDYIYDHFDECKLIAFFSDGTEYKHYVESLVEMEVESTYRFIQAMNGNGYSVGDINPDLCHMLSSAYFNGVFETIAHDMSREEAMQYVAAMTDFFSAGWDRLLGL